MARKKTKPNFWETPNNTAVHFGRIYPELVKHTDFKLLSISARLLYLEMLEASAGKKEFTFTVTHYKDRGWTAPTFTRARNELIKARFIAIVFNGKTTRTPSKYAFVKEWKK